MATKLSYPTVVSREVPTKDPRTGKPLIVTLESALVRIKVKGSRESFTLPYDRLLSVAAMANAPHRELRTVNRGAIRS